MVLSRLLQAFPRWPLLLSMLLGAGWGHTAMAADKVDNSIPLRQIQTFSEVFSLIKSDYVDHASDKKLMEGAISGMVSALDPHSAYLSPKELKEMQSFTDGKFGGVGLEVAADHGVLRVIAPIDGTPAAKAGIRSGDLIVKIDGKAVQGLGLSAAVDRMRGKVGTTVELTLLRPHAAKPMTVKLTRAIIKVQSVRASLLAPGYGYLRISQFQDNTGVETRRAVERLEKESGGRLKGLILDLRNNPGGVLGAGVETADTFLDRGLIVYTKGRAANSDMRFTAHGPDALHGAPLIVLINGGSASAAEIVTGALKDDGRALVMGSRSFGKGSVQTIIPLDDGGALKLTTALYYTPLGCSIQGEGIVPNVAIRPANAEQEALDQDLLRESELQGVLKAPAQCRAQKPQYTILEPTPPAVPKKDQAPNFSDKPDLRTDFTLREALDVLQGKPVPVDVDGKTVPMVIPLPAVTARKAG
ncbi:S41 family peptidase [Acidithiobacillus caldus]|uniref:Peptidase S41 n=1 Tax=Acidithiobacillus caldus TaxID=33059 RepID=A0A1E7YMX8_9PROT|nr:S41 family peptidase [Acidithiobacillus caldus]OFC35296.1 peptidase S41 [Acidithiobacillus caldus]OFC35943.1 peptidase S41 [Acidithiobacillus caldus]OFC37935.1 peptidase S41 [Acidithiobacillus caldus]